MMKNKDTAFIIIGAIVMAAVNVLFFTAPGGTAALINL